MRAIEIWKQFNATFRIVLVAALVVAIASIAWRLWPKHAPGPSAVLQPTFQPAIETKPIALARLGAALSGKESEYRGKLTVTVRDTVRSETGAPVVRERSIEVLIPRDDRPPELRSADGLQAVASYSPIRRPWIRWAPGLLIGGSIDDSGRLSPHGGAVLFRAWNHLDIGAGSSRYGVGPVLGYEAWREFTLLAQYNAIRFRPEVGRWSVGLAYRF